MAITTTPLPADTGAEAVRRRLRGRRIDVGGVVLRVALLLSLTFSLLVLAVLLYDVVTGGWDVFASRFQSFMSGTLRFSAAESGISQALRGTLWIGVFVVLLAFPLGIAAALYLEEYAADNRVTRFIDVNIRNLAGVPSIVYGILGFTIFVKSLSALTGGRSVVAGGLTLAVLVLPLVIITSAEAIRAVPDELRQAGYGLGATRWEVSRTQVLPYAAPGILTGTVLSLARALGEAAPLILVGAVVGRLGSNPGLFDLGSLDQRFTALPIVITYWAGLPQADFRALTAAAIVVILVIVLLANAAAILLRNRFESKRG
ncbi:MAG: phosphate ABC transporter permease PstA [Actinomycetota bacterium]|nr:phosphate ABC transporter permease PstA [Actinomycetota bacterium]